MAAIPGFPLRSHGSSSSEDGIRPSPVVTAAQKTCCLFYSCLALFGCIASFIALPLPYALLSSSAILLGCVVLGSSACCSRRSGIRPYQPRFWLPHDYVGSRTWRTVFMNKFNILRNSLPNWRFPRASRVERHEPVGVASSDLPSPLNREPRPIPLSVTAAQRPATPERTTFGVLNRAGISHVTTATPHAPAPLPKKSISYADATRNRMPNPDQAIHTRAEPPVITVRKTFGGPPSTNREPIGERGNMSAIPPKQGSPFTVWGAPVQEPVGSAQKPRDELGSQQARYAPIGTTGKTADLANRAFPPQRDPVGNC